MPEPPSLSSGATEATEGSGGASDPTVNPTTPSASASASGSGPGDDATESSGMTDDDSGSTSTGVEYTSAPEDTSSSSGLLDTDSGPTSSTTTSTGGDPVGIGHEPQPAIDVPGRVMELVVADFDDDASDDFVVVADGANVVELFLGDGVGGFDSSSSVDLDSWGFAVDIGDLDGNGTLDVVAAEGVLPGRFHVLMGDGDGALAQSEEHILAGQQMDVVLGDFDDDGDLDAVTSDSFSDQLTVMRNAGDGTFSAETPFDSVTIPTRLRAAYVDDDSELDLLLGGMFTISAWLGDGTGAFSVTETMVDVLPVGFAVADFDGDGNVDVFSGDMYVHSVEVGLHLGNGDGTFADPDAFDLDGSIYHAAVGDLDDDGNLDIAASPGEPGTGGIYILLGAGDGTFDTPFLLESDEDFGAIAVADIDANGVDDIVAATTADDAGDVIVYLAP